MSVVGSEVLATVDGTGRARDHDQHEEGARRVWEADPETIRAAAAGDLDAFDELVRGYQGPVWRFLRTLVADPTLAEDLTQETFLRAFTRLNGFAFRSRFSTWLFRVAHNLAVDALRARDRGRRAALLLVPRPDESSPETTVELGAAIATLTPKLREAVLLIDVVGLTYADAGKVLGVAAGTVKSRVFHARRQLVTWFDADDEGARREM